MFDRRLLIATFGAALGIFGAIAALVWAPGAALVSAVGAVIAATAAVVQRPTAPSAPVEAASVNHVAPQNTDTDTDTDTATAAEPSEISQPIELATTSAPSAQHSTPPPGPSTNKPPNGGAAVPPSASPALTDPETGLFSQDYFDIAIDARIAAARRHLRPVGVIMLEVVDGLRVGKVETTEPKRVAEAIQETLREADTACRRSDGRFALLLEDTPENGAIWTVERIRRFLAERDPTLTLWAGVACYPAHGFSSESLVAQAGAALDIAREWRQDRIEVAVGE